MVGLLFTLPPSPTNLKSSRNSWIMVLFLWLMGPAALPLILPLFARIARLLPSWRHWRMRSNPPSPPLFFAPYAICGVQRGFNFPWPCGEFFSYAFSSCRGDQLIDCNPSYHSYYIIMFIFTNTIPFK